MDAGCRPGTKRLFNGLDVSRIPTDDEFESMSEADRCKWCAYFFAKDIEHWVCFVQNPKVHT
jgi:hypothetical protein